VDVVAFLFVDAQPGVVVAVVVGGAAFGNRGGQVFPVVRCSRNAVTRTNGRHVAVGVMGEIDVCTVFKDFIQPVSP